MPDFDKKILSECSMFAKTNEKDELVITADFPNFEERHLKTEVEDGMLSVSATKNTRVKKTNTSIRRHTGFSICVNKYNPEKRSQVFKDHRLTITIPRV